MEICTVNINTKIELKHFYINTWSTMKHIDVAKIARILRVIVWAAVRKVISFAKEF